MAQGNSRALNSQWGGPTVLTAAMNGGQYMHLKCKVRNDPCCLFYCKDIIEHICSSREALLCVCG